METKETINISSIVETLCSFYTRVVEKEACLKKILPILKAAIKIRIETCLNKLLLKAVNTNKRRRRVVAANDRMSILACSITQSFIKQYRRPCCSPRFTKNVCRGLQITFTTLKVLNFAGI